MWRISQLMHNGQTLPCPMATTPSNLLRKPALSKGSNPKWSRKSHLDRLGPVPNGISCSIWKSARIRAGRRAAGNAPRPRPPQRETPSPHRAAGTARIWVPRTKRGPPFGGPLGRSGGEARIRTGGKGFAGLCLTTWPLRRKRTVKNGPEMQWSGQRGSNPRPQPWQGCALPTEPCPLAGY